MAFSSRDLLHSKSETELQRSGSSVSFWEECEADESARLSRHTTKESEVDEALKTLNEWNIDHLKPLLKNLQSQLDVTSEVDVTLRRISRPAFVDSFCKPIESLMRPDGSFLVMSLSVYNLADTENTNNIRVGKILILVALGGDGDYQTCMKTCLRLYGLRDLDCVNQEAICLVHDLVGIAIGLQNRRVLPTHDQSLNEHMDALHGIADTGSDGGQKLGMASHFQSLLRLIRKMMRSEDLEEASQSHGTHAAIKKPRPKKDAATMLRTLKNIERDGKAKYKVLSATAWRRIRAAALYALATERQFEHFIHHEEVLQEAALKSMHPTSKAGRDRKMLHHRPDDMEGDCDKVNYLKNLPNTIDQVPSEPDPSTPEGKLIALVKSWSKMSPSEISSVVATKQEELLSYLSLTGIQPLISSVPLPKIDTHVVTKDSRAQLMRTKNNKLAASAPSLPQPRRVAKRKPKHSQPTTISRLQRKGASTGAPSTSAAKQQSSPWSTAKIGLQRPNTSPRRSKIQLFDEITSQQHVPALRRNSSLRQSASRDSLRRNRSSSALSHTFSVK